MTAGCDREPASVPLLCFAMHAVWRSRKQVKWAATNALTGRNRRQLEQEATSFLLLLLFLFLFASRESRVASFEARGSKLERGSISQAQRVEGMKISGERSAQS